MGGSNGRRECLAEVFALAIVFLVFLGLCKLVSRVGLALPGGPVAWALVAVAFVVFVFVLCVAAARADREWVDASRRRDEVSR